MTSFAWVPADHVRRDHQLSSPGFYLRGAHPYPAFTFYKYHQECSWPTFRTDPVQDISKPMLRTNQESQSSTVQKSKTELVSARAPSQRYKARAPVSSVPAAASGTSMSTIIIAVLVCSAVIVTVVVPIVILLSQKAAQPPVTQPPGTQSQNCTYRCNNTQCVGYQTWCNGIADCTDGSDEPPGCQNSIVCPKEAVSYCSITKKCIFSVQRCDNYQDCPDDSDEANCTCQSFQYTCIAGRCIYKDWLCDGVKDCPFGDDEAQCAGCNANTEFKCAQRTTSNSVQCVSLSAVCDGNSNCFDSSDEANCFAVGTPSSPQIVNVTYKDVKGNNICADNWSMLWSDLVCQSAGFLSSMYTSAVQTAGGSLFLNINAYRSNLSILASFETTSNCSGKAVSFGCNQYECGRRTVPSNSVGPYVINGQRAAYGAWPWQAAIEFGSFFCGGILINQYWVLTAAHCTLVNGYHVRTSNVDISLGLTNLQDPQRNYRSVAAVYNHPYYDSVAITNDIGLYKLADPVTYSDTIRPLCLPDANVDLNQFKVCVSTGWGKTIKDTQSDDLLQTRMNIMSKEACNAAGDTKVNYTVDICIGSTPGIGQNNICSGDSGGPFACEDQNGRWTVIGVHSYVHGSGGTVAYDECTLSVVTRVTAFLDWISSTTAAN